MHNKWLHSWFLGVGCIILIAPLTGLIAWGISHSVDWFWGLFWFYTGVGVLCVIYDAINHIRAHRGLFDHSEGCLSLKMFKKKVLDVSPGVEA